MAQKSSIQKLCNILTFICYTIQCYKQFWSVNISQFTNLNNQNLKNLMIVNNNDTC